VRLVVRELVADGARQRGVANGRSAGRLRETTATTESEGGPRRRATIGNGVACGLGSRRADP